jgi:Capsule polysaccharide biosynthesis protein
MTLSRATSLPETIRLYARVFRTRAITERDLRELRRNHGDVLGPAPAPTGGVALLASLSYSPFQLKLEGMLAKSFQLHGLEPVAAIPAEGRLPARYLELFGVRRFVRLEDYLTPELEDEARREGESLLEGVREPDDLRRLTFRGVDVGRQALSTVSRYLHEGGVDLADAEARELLGRLLPSAVRSTLAFERLLDDVQPELVLFNERNYADQGPLSDLALGRGLNVVQFVGGFEDDTLVLKRFTAETKAIHPRSLADESWARVRALPWGERQERELEEDFSKRYDGSTYHARLNQSWTRPRTRGEVVAELGLDPSRKTAVVFSHVLWDANMFYGRDLFADQEEWFVETVRAAAANDAVNWVIKLHPANVWKRKRDGVTDELDELVAIRKHVGSLPQHVRVLEPTSDVSTWSLFDATDWGVTIRGSVGFELPCFGVPVLTAGTGFYSGRGFTVDSDTAEEYLGRLARIQDVPPPDGEAVELARRHAHALFRLRQTRFHSFKTAYMPLDRIDHPFEATIVVSARTPDELAADLDRVGQWAVRSRELDYLEL